MNLGSMPNGHRQAVAEAMAELSSHPQVRALALTGSLARGDALPGSDADLLMIIDEGGLADRPDHRLRFGTMVEEHRYTLERARDGVACRPGVCWAFMECRPLHDPEGVISELAAAARARVGAYEMPADEARSTWFWLRKNRAKLSHALETEDTLLAGYLASTTAREILSDLFALDRVPPPPTGSAFVRLDTLASTADVRALFDGGSLERGQAAVRLIDGILAALPLHEGVPSAPPHSAPDS
jgi:predicted nucleotidyltransferase